MKWYQKEKKKAIDRYQAGYYPRHPRTPNLLVCGLYELGYLVADFGPMVINLFDAVYTNTRKLIVFIVGLLIELSTVIVLIGTIAFSVFHSIELLRKAGATGGLEYIGILMFEVVFISSTATLTKSLVKKKTKLSWFGLIFSASGFIIGILFVEWSNITGMAPTLTGQIIGFFTPILLIIAEGILAYQYLNQSEEDDQTQLLEIMRRNQLTVGDVRRAIQLYLNQRTDSQTERIGQPESDTHPIGQDESDREETDNRTVVGQQVSDNKTGQSDSQTELVGQQTSDNEIGQSESDSKILSNPDNPTSLESEASTDEAIGQSDITERPVKNQTLSDERIGQKTDSEEIGQSDSDSDTHNPKIGQKENQTPDSNQTTGQSDKKTDTSRTEKKSDKVIQFKKKKSDRQARELSVEEIKKMAEEFKSENGELPSIRKLADLASCSKYKAEKAINELKEAK